MHQVGEILLVQKFVPPAPPHGFWMKYGKLTRFQNLSPEKGRTNSLRKKAMFDIW